jgi:hypothetical protein
MDENNENAQSCLDAVMEAVWKDDDHDEVCGGTNSYKTTDGKVVFLTAYQLWALMSTHFKTSFLVL